MQAGHSPQQLLRAAKAYLRSCFVHESPPHASELARQLNLSPSCFTKRFRFAVGIAPSAYLKGHQVARAKQLLARTRISTTSIGYYAAFQTRATFFRVFRKFTGLTPDEYRRNSWGGGTSEKNDTRRA